MPLCLGGGACGNCSNLHELAQVDDERKFWEKHMPVNQIGMIVATKYINDTHVRRREKVRSISGLTSISSVDALFRSFASGMLAASMASM